MKKNEKEQLEESLSICEYLLRDDPHNARVLFKRGLLLKSLGRFAEVADSFEQVIKIAPRDNQAHLNLGNALASLGYFERAVRAYNNAIRIEPNFVRAHVYRGLSLKSIGRFEEAIFSFDYALTLDCNQAEAHFYRASALEELARFREASCSYERALESNLSHFSCQMQYLLAVMCLEGKKVRPNYLRALHLLERVVERSSRYQASAKKRYERTKEILKVSHSLINGQARENKVNNKNDEVDLIPAEITHEIVKFGIFRHVRKCRIAKTNSYFRYCCIL